MRVLGLDVGSKTIGVAVSDELEISAQGVEVIRRTSLDKDLSRVMELVNNTDSGRIVVGMPRNMNGTYGPAAQGVNEFVDKLRGVCSVPIELWDERMTTVVANRALLEADVRRDKRRKVIDKVAAAVILQGWLDYTTGR